ncbi:DUF3822 family protein [Winogradskyella thalassocola]|uniref:DUF3822 domain-containing protein n=1 Tax=Winogradskyella thalassocola TaxID=262004 RepID=A0A1G8CPY6_9FLAO|nr:DUF3822 family protein [Winogradskyella thalassocola]SDH47289.1 Protein of unknown function [Winogradskyella thalassocola]
MKINDIKELSIQINLNGLSFCILNRTQNTLEFLKTIPFEQKTTPIEVLNYLKAELSSNTVFSEDFNAVLVIHQNELATLVPEELYNVEHKADYLKFNSKILRNDFITEDDIAINNSVNVYVPYVNINNYIFDTFGEFVYKHASSVLINSHLQHTETKEEPIVYLNINKSTVEVLVIEKNKLQLFNVFEYFSKEDFLYYILFVFEQLKLDVETTSIELSGNIDKDDDLYNVLYTYVRHVHFIDKDYKFSVSTDIDRRYLHKHFLILNSF